jgi:uncharacterized membrane protein
MILTKMQLFKRRSDNSKHPLQSNTLQGLIIYLIVYILKQLGLIDHADPLQAVNEIPGNGEAIIQIIAQGVGLYKIIKGLFNKQRGPLSIREHSHEDK